MNEFEQLRYMNKVMSAIAHEWRYRLLLTIEEKKRIHQKDLLNIFNNFKDIHPVEQSTISHHLSILKNVRVIKTERKGKNVFYTFNQPLMKEIQKFAKDHVKKWR
ncbi:MAG: hypothetical protein ABIJ16_02545 [Bacteroidota bacterium]